MHPVTALPCSFSRWVAMLADRRFGLLCLCMVACGDPSTGTSPSPGKADDSPRQHQAQRYGVDLPLRVDLRDGAPPLVKVCHRFHCFEENRELVPLDPTLWELVAPRLRQVSRAVTSAVDERTFIAWFVSVLERVVARTQRWYRPPLGMGDELAREGPIISDEPSGESLPWSCTGRTCSTLRSQIAALERDGLARRLSPPAGRIWSERPGDLMKVESKQAGGMDCIDNAVNAATYLLLAAKLGLLSDHSVPAEPDYAQQHLRYGLIFPWGHYSPTYREDQTGRAWILDTWFGTTGAPAIIVSRELFEDEDAFWSEYWLHSQ